MELEQVSANMTHTHTQQPRFSINAFSACCRPATPAQIVRLCDSVEDFLIMLAIVRALLFGGAGVESLLTVVQNGVAITSIVQSPSTMNT